MNRFPIPFAIVPNPIADPNNAAAWMLGVILLAFSQPVKCNAVEGEPPQPTADAVQNGLDRDHFVVETTIEMDGQMIDRHQVIFDAGIAYDVVGDGSRFITVFGDDHVTLLDRMTQVRTEVPHATLIDVTQRAAGAARQSLKSQQLGVDVKPVRRGDDYAASFGPFDYVIKTVAPPIESIAADYATFADAAVRLNVMQQKVGIPPFARLALSRRIAADGRMPIETQITWKSESKATAYRIRTSVMPASETDRQQAETLSTLVKLYQPVVLADFPARN